MPGNEKHVVSCLVESSVSDRTYELPHLGKLRSVSMPFKNERIQVRTQEEQLKFSSNDRFKKADVYINNVGISVKEPVSPLYNKIRRKHVLPLLNILLKDSERSDEILNKLVNRI